MSQKHPTRLRFSHGRTDAPVYIVGSWTQPPWEPQEMSSSDEKTADGNTTFYKDLEDLEPGEYQYKFRLGTGDQWVTDNNTPTATDGSGNVNNVLTVHAEEPGRVGQETKASAPEKDMTTTDDASSSHYSNKESSIAEQAVTALPTQESEEAPQTSNADVPCEVTASKVISEPIGSEESHQTQHVQNPFSKGEPEKAAEAPQLGTPPAPVEANETLEAPEPVTKTHKSEAEAQPPVVEELQSSIQIQKSAAEILEPPAQAHEPTTEIHEPVIKAPELLTEKVDPIPETHEPIPETNEAPPETHETSQEMHEVTLETHEPPVETHEAPVETLEPALETHEPTSKTHEKMKMPEPASEIPESGIAAKEPAAEKQEPTAEPREPTVEIHEPVVEEHKPTPETREPATTHETVLEKADHSPEIPLPHVEKYEPSPVTRAPAEAHEPVLKAQEPEPETATKITKPSEPATVAHTPKVSHELEQTNDPTISPEAEKADETAAAVASTKDDAPGEKLEADGTQRITPIHEPVEPYQDTLLSEPTQSHSTKVLNEDAVPSEPEATHGNARETHITELQESVLEEDNIEIHGSKATAEVTEEEPSKPEQEPPAKQHIDIIDELHAKPQAELLREAGPEFPNEDKDVIVNPAQFDPGVHSPQNAALPTATGSELEAPDPVETESPVLSHSELRREKPQEPSQEFTPVSASKPGFEQEGESFAKSSATTDTDAALEALQPGDHQLPINEQESTPSQTEVHEPIMTEPKEPMPTSTDEVAAESPPDAVNASTVEDVSEPSKALSVAADEANIPFTVVETVPDTEQPKYGDLLPERLPNHSFQRSSDAEPDAEYERRSTLPEITPLASDNPAKPEVPLLVIEKTGDEPRHGDDFGPGATSAQRLAHRLRQADSQPDEVIVPPSLADPPREIVLNETFTGSNPEGQVSLLPHELVDAVEDPPEGGAETSSSIETQKQDVLFPGLERIRSKAGAAREDPPLDALPTDTEEIYKQIETIQKRVPIDKSVPDITQERSIPSGSASPGLATHSPFPPAVSPRPGSPVHHVDDKDSKSVVTEQKEAVELPPPVMPIVEEISEIVEPEPAIDDTKDQVLSSEAEPTSKSPITPPMTPDSKDRAVRETTFVDAESSTQAVERATEIDESAREIMSTGAPAEETQIQSEGLKQRKTAPAGEDIAPGPALAAALKPEGREGFLQAVWRMILENFLQPLARWFASFATREQAIAN